MMQFENVTNTGPFIMNMYYLIILYIKVLCETTEIPEAKEIPMWE